MAISLLSLVGLFISIYTTLRAVGVIGTLACGISGGCEIVQTSAFAVFPPSNLVEWGVSVAILGLFGYGLLFAVSFYGVVGSVQRRWVSAALLLLGSGAFVFSLYLSAMEMWFIHAWCRWCIVSAILSTLIFFLSLFEIRGIKRGPAA